MTTGASASLTASFTGATAGPFTGEVDLAIDTGGDLLTIDSAGDALVVTSAITFTGGGAAALVPDFANTLETEGWIGLETEGGQLLETEGS